MVDAAGQRPWGTPRDASWRVPRSDACRHRIDPCELMSYNLHQLHAFTTIVSSGSLGRAAALLNVTQPALSRTIKRLEEDVGASLFERHVKGMQLTDIGAALLPHAQLLLREAENAREEIDAMR